MIQDVFYRDFQNCCNPEFYQNEEFALSRCIKNRNLRINVINTVKNSIFNNAADLNIYF